MLGLKSTESVKNSFKDLRILTVYSLYVFETIKYIKEHEINIFFESKHHYNTRNKIIFDKHNLHFYKNKTKYMGKKLFTQLPNSIKNE